jgi:hypothetical protein
MSHHTKLHLCGIVVCNYKPQITIYYDYTVLPPVTHHAYHIYVPPYSVMMSTVLFFWSLWPFHVSCTYKQWDGIITIQRSSCKVLFLSHFKQTLICSTVLAKISNKISQPSGQWELSLHDRQTDRTITTTALCNCFSKTTKMNHILENVSKG